MLKEERYDKILELLDEETYTSASSLARRLFVSMPTVRRDLAELAARGLLIRSHGGAKRLNSEHTVMPTDFRESHCRMEKRRICAAAAELINDGDVVFIDASTTTLDIADFLSGKRSISVVTNSIPLSVALRDKKIRCYTTGGELQENSYGYAGSYAEAFVREFNFDLTLFSSYGVTEQGIIVDASLSETALRREVIRLSTKKIFLADHTKFDVTAPFNLIKLKEADAVITDRCEKTKDFLIPFGDKAMIV